MPDIPPLSPFGWQGIRLDIPSDWALSRVQGERKKGSVQIADEYAVRAEVRWESVKKVSAPMEDVVDGFVEQMRKRAGRKARIEITRNVSIPGPDGLEYEALRCSGDVRSMWLLARCSDCRRVIGVNLLPRPGKSVSRELAAAVFASLAAHTDDELDLWDMFDLRFKLTSAMRLKKFDLRTGCLELGFSDGTREYYVKRLGLAEIVLRKTTVADWFQSSEAKLLKAYAYEAYSAEVHGHEATRLLGKLSLSRRVRKAAVRGVFYHGYAWHCPQQNKIYVMRATTRDEEDEAFEQHVQMLQCHQDDESE